MSEYGLKIKNYQAASIYEYQNGLRNRLDQTDAMLTNSLFLDFLKENGLKIWKEESTRDVICLAFDYGTDDYDKAVGKLSKIENEELRKQLLVNLENNKDKCVRITKQELRTMYYEDGVTITYKTYNKSGKLIKSEDIHYKMLYRTPGKAKKGTCMFINSKLYKKAHEFLYMGIKLPQKNSPIVQMGAYSSLITSSIIGKIQIKPEEILVLKDVDRNFITKALTIDIDENKHCVVKDIDEYKLKNTMFDGQALIDSSIFPEWADGFILLRHHMTKCAAFNTHIKKFMIEHFGDEYENAYVEDMWGRKVKVANIKLITTDNAIKWLTFGVSFEHWAEWLRKNDCMWGIVKTTHESKLGNVQRMSYQMVNSLDINTMESVTSKSVDYINKLKTDDDTFLEYLERTSNFSNDHEVLIALVKHNPDFIRSDYFRSRRYEIIKAYVLDFKSGRTVQDADNLTIVGSPYGMLLHSVGINVDEDTTFEHEDGTIQCWTERFKDDEYLAAFRSPFNSRNNLGYLHNHYHEYFDKYFKLGRLVVAINMNGTDFQDRSNGSDQDSDSIYTTNQQDIVNHAKECYINYPTIVNNIPKDKNIYDYDMKDFAKIDNKLAAAQRSIGESSNLAQLCLTYTYNYSDKKYIDYVCELAVLAQIAIDSAKRTFDINVEDEIKYIKSNMNIAENGLPYFWQITKKDKRKARNDEERRMRQKQNREKIKERINEELRCPMNYLYGLKLNEYKNQQSTIPIEKFFINHIQENNRRKSKKAEELIEKYSIDLYNFNVNNKDENWNDSDELSLLTIKFDELINDIKQIYISGNYLGLMSWLINRAFLIGSGVKSKENVIDSNTEKNKALLLKILYAVNKNAFLACFCVQQQKNDL